MCELEVYLKRPNSSQKVASEIIYAAADRGTLFVRDVVGSTTKLDGTIVSEVDINRERMELKESPILRPLLEFISEYDDCLSTGKYEGELEERWEEVKNRGDQMVRELWVKFKKANAS